MGEEIACNILCRQSDEVIKFIGQTQIRMFVLFVHGLSIKFSNTTQCEILL